MKKFICGLSTGYLLTSFFSIQAPSTTFWITLVSFLTIVLPLTYVRHKLDDDVHEGDF